MYPAFFVSSGDSVCQEEGTVVYIVDTLTHLAKMAPTLGRIAGTIYHRRSYSKYAVFM